MQKKARTIRPIEVILIIFLFEKFVFFMHLIHFIIKINNSAEIEARHRLSALLIDKTANVAIRVISKKIER